MSFLDKFASAADRLAGAGARSRMPDERLAKRKGAAQAVNQQIQLAQVATNPGAARTARRQAERQLVEEVGAKEAKRLMEQTARKVRDSFNS